MHRLSRYAAARAFTSLRWCQVSASGAGAVAADGVRQPRFGELRVVPLNSHPKGAKKVAEECVLRTRLGIQLTDGTVIREEKPFIFYKGARQCLVGLEQAVELLHVGQRARVEIPAHLAYGEQGAEGIPPDADVVLTVEIISQASANKAFTTSLIHNKSKRYRQGN
ncbi:FK506-binding protein 2 [Diplonema papillatum]|nr:FK506-binding protein 2 [Diplonema papillatum]